MAKSVLVQIEIDSDTVARMDEIKERFSTTRAAIVRGALDRELPRLEAAKSPFETKPATSR